MDIAIMGMIIFSYVMIKRIIKGIINFIKNNQ